MKCNMSGAKIGFGRFSIRRATLEALYGDDMAVSTPYSRDIEGRFEKCPEVGRDGWRSERESILLKI